MPATPPFDDFDPMAHAAEDAGRVQSWLTATTSGSAAWTAQESFLVIPGPWQKSTCFWYDILADECFSVTQEDSLTESDVVNYWQFVEKGDLEEIRSFVSHGVFSLDLASRSTNTIDAVWVRKWKTRHPPVVKSRMCGRGFMDVQRKGVHRHSSTASALSHRLAITLGAQYFWDCEAFDVSTAFLQGLRFQEIEARAKELGHECKRIRTVWLQPPANVWRHLRLLGFTTVEDIERSLFVLLLNKAMY